MKRFLLWLLWTLAAPWPVAWANATLQSLNVAFESGFNEPRLYLGGADAEAIERQIDLLLKQYEKQGAINPGQIRAIVLRLFLDGRLQEGIWALDNLGLVAEAEWFSQKLEHLLRAGPLLVNQEVGKGISNTRWGLVQSFPVIVKPEDRDWSGAREAEVWAYHLDRILGLNLVATSVSTPLLGRPHSLQAAILGARESGLNFRDKGYNASYPEMFILDFLIGNTDRHPQNSLFSPFGFLVAIDNGRASAIFEHQKNSEVWWAKYSHYPFTRWPRQAVVETIASVQIETFKQEFSHYAPAEVVRYVAQRLQILKTDFQPLTSVPRARALSSAGRMQALSLSDEEIEASYHSIYKSARIRRKQLTSSFYKMLNNIEKELKILDPDREHPVHSIADLRLTVNGHVVRYYIELQREILTPKQITSFMQLIYELHEKQKLLEFEVPVLLGYLHRFKPIQQNHLKYLMLLGASEDSFKEILENPLYWESFRETLEKSERGAENYGKVWNWYRSVAAHWGVCRSALGGRP